MINVFFIADLHLGHKNIIGYNRPEFNNLEEMHEAIVDRWNAVVRPKDVVYVLGDVAFGKQNIHYMAQLNGRKHLVLGNHDTCDIKEYQLYFDHIWGCIGYKNCILTHIPIHPQQFYRFTVNIHGHVHHEDQQLMKDWRYFNVCADHTNLTPVAWEDIKKEINKHHFGLLTGK